MRTIDASAGSSPVDSHRLLKDSLDECQRSCQQSGQWSERFRRKVSSTMLIKQHRMLTISSESFSAVNGAPTSFNNDPEDLNCDATIDELDNVRLREITGKAISGSLLLLIKWFKRSRKFYCLSCVLWVLTIIRHLEV